MRPDLKTVNSLAVHLHGRRVGIIYRLAGDRHLFAFEQDYSLEAFNVTNTPTFATPPMTYGASNFGVIDSYLCRRPRFARDAGCDQVLLFRSLCRSALGSRELIPPETLKIIDGQATGNTVLQSRRRS